MTYLFVNNVHCTLYIVYCTMYTVSLVMSYELCYTTLHIYIRDKKVFSLNIHIYIDIIKKFYKYL